MFMPRPLPEPDPYDLDEQVDWMTYSHAELYRMVHEGVDLSGATDVSAHWATLGEELEQISTDLAAAVAQVEHAWEGAAADSARESVGHLVDWTKDTGVGALEVSGCVTREINNLAHARGAMPVPPPGLGPLPPLPPLPSPGPLPSPVPMPPPGPLPPLGHPKPSPVQTMTPDTFTGRDFGSVAAISSDNTQLLSDRHEAHKQAAQVMARFQHGSREVYGTVPQFASPYEQGRKMPRPDPQPTPPQHVPPPDPTPGPTPGPAPRGGGAVPGAPFGQEPADSGRATPGAPAAAASTVAAAARHEERTERSSGSGGRPMGMMPGMGGGQRTEDDERRAPTYLEGDDDIWGVGGTGVAPPVIGENGGA